MGSIDLLSTAWAPAHRILEPVEAGVRCEQDDLRARQGPVDLGDALDGLRWCAEVVDDDDIGTGIGHDRADRPVP
jgi:hypothetical protein